MSARFARAWWIVGAPCRAVLVGLILGYRSTLGQLLAGRCRFHPTCSAYAIEAIRIHGAVKGSGLAVWRVLRCSPLTAGGPDPVPSRRSRTAGQAV
jgi:putative membrane protein insertion efficiency factor